MSAMMISEAYPAFEDKDAFIQSKLPLVYHLAHKYNRPSELDDLISEGTIALLEAYSRYDSRRGVLFTTFAYPAIAGAMSDYLRDRTGTIRPSKRAYRTGGSILRNDLKNRSAVDIAVELGISTAQAARGLQSLKIHEQTSINIVLPDGEEGNLLDSIGTVDNLLPIWLDDFSSTLPKFERNVFSLLLKEKNRSEIISELGLSASQLSRFVLEIKRKFKSFMGITEGRENPMTKSSEVVSRKVNLEEAKKNGIKTVLDNVEWFTDLTSPITPTIGVTSTGLNLNPSAAKSLNVEVKEFVEIGYNSVDKRLIIRKGSSGIRLSKGYGDASGAVGPAAKGKRLSVWLADKNIVPKRYALEFDDIAQVYFIDVEIAKAGN
ncbi:sigma-70 family RNA polymerase sigma factor [Paenibacillus sp. FSL M7-0547]|uniref:sigma-70 family RNA polymerase sigma factor n=1 Tax=Paenibacillus sp. FSL M7-0547 TaxID=2954755 RepID=UPI0030FC08ED